MPKALIEDWDRFSAFLAAQPLCQWSAKKEQEIAAGMHGERSGAAVRPPPKNDNAELAAALSAMA